MGIESPDYGLDDPNHKKSGPERGNSESLDGNFETGRSLEGAGRHARRPEVIKENIASIRESEAAAKKKEPDPDDLLKELNNSTKNV